MSTRQVVLKGRGISQRTTRQIIHLAKAATSIKECPYRKGWVQWSVWTTAFKYKKESNENIYNALVDAGVLCNARQNSSADYPDLLPQRGTRHQPLTSLMVASNV